MFVWIVCLTIEESWPASLAGRRLRLLRGSVMPQRRLVSSYSGKAALLTSVSESSDDFFGRAIGLHLSARPRFGRMSICWNRATCETSMRSGV
jgi:hypothetical protein